MEKEIFDLYVAVYPKRCEIGPQLLLFVNWKSHAGFPLLTQSMTVDDLVRHFRIILQLHCVGTFSINSVEPHKTRPTIYATKIYPNNYSFIIMRANGRPRCCNVRNFTDEKGRKVVSGVAD